MANHNPHYLGFDKRPALEFICMFPIILTAISIGYVPLALVIQIVDRPMEWRLPAVFFTWMFVGGFITTINEGIILSKYFKKNNT
jgi:hypothetical protein